MGQNNSRCNCVLLKRFQKIVKGDGHWGLGPIPIYLFLKPNFFKFYLLKR